MPPIVKGLPGPVYSGIRKRYVPGTGWTSAHVYQFSNSTDANAFAAAQAATNVNVVDVDDRVPYTVEVSTPTADGGSGDDPVDIYELPPLDETSDATDSPAFKALSETEQNLIKEYIDDPTTAPAVTSPEGIAFYLLLLNGTRQYLKPTTEFRWTRVVSDAGLSAGLAGAFDSIGRIFTTSTLNTSVAPPTVWQNAISSAAAATPAATTDYAKGWLKQQPAITRRGINRNEITLRWVLENWSTTLYGNAI